jgi:hypothetical protein
MAYAHDIKAGARRFGAQIVEILNGGNPAEIIPRERPIAIVDSRRQPSLRGLFSPSRENRAGRSQ